MNSRFTGRFDRIAGSRSRPRSSLGWSRPNRFSSGRPFPRHRSSFVRGRRYEGRGRSGGALGRRGRFRSNSSWKPSFRPRIDYRSQSRFGWNREVSKLRFGFGGRNAATSLRPLARRFRLRQLRRAKPYKGRLPLYRAQRRLGYRTYARISPLNFFYTSKQARMSDELYRDSIRERLGRFVVYYYGFRMYLVNALRLKKVTTFLLARKTGNNFFVTVFSRSGRMIFYKSAGMLKLTGPRRSTKEAAQQVMIAVVERLKKDKIRRIGVVVRTHVNRVVFSAIKKLFYLYRGGMSTLIVSLRAKSHNGLRGRKKRR